MDSTDIARYFIKQKRVFGKNCLEVCNEIFSAERIEEEEDNLPFMIEYVINPPMSQRMKNINWDGKIFQEISWDMRDKEFELFCNKLKSAIILAEWMEKIRFDAPLREFQGKKFFQVFELLISLSKMNENSDIIEWGDDAGGTNDGGIDSYGTVDSDTLYIIQSKATKLKPNFYREMFGTYALLKQNSKYRNKFTSAIDQSWPYHKTILILMSSKEPNSKLRFKKNELYRLDGSVEFMVMDPWAISWFLVTTSQNEIFKENKTLGKKQDLDLLIAELALIAEDLTPAESIDPADY